MATWPEVKLGSEPEEEYDRTIAAQYACAESRSRVDYTKVKRVKGEYVQGLACVRCPVKRAIRIDVLTGDRLGSGGYDYHDAPG